MYLERVMHPPLAYFLVASWAFVKKRKLGYYCSQFLSKTLQFQILDLEWCVNV